MESLLYRCRAFELDSEASQARRDGVDTETVGTSGPDCLS